MIGCTSGFVRLHIGIAGSLYGGPKGHSESDIRYSETPGRMSVIGTFPARIPKIMQCSIFYLFNVTGLLPGTTYELTVVAVSQGGNVVARSQSSNSLQITTTVTGNSTLCVHRCHVTCGHIF